MIEYKHLEQIQRLMSTKSTSEFGVGHSTSRIKRNFEDGSGALNKIKIECNSVVEYAANVYCLEDDKSSYARPSSYARLRFLLHAKMLEWLQRNNKDKDRALPLVDIAMSRVFTGKPKTQAECGKVLGVGQSTYSEGWKRYVDDAEDILSDLLFQANLVAGDYFYNEKLALDTTDKSMV